MSDHVINIQMHGPNGMVSVCPTTFHKDAFGNLQIIQGENVVKTRSEDVWGIYSWIREAFTEQFEGLCDSVQTQED